MKCSKKNHCLSFKSLIRIMFFLYYCIIIQKQTHESLGHYSDYFFLFHYDKVTIKYVVSKGYINN